MTVQIAQNAPDNTGAERAGDGREASPKGDETPRFSFALPEDPLHRDHLAAVGQLAAGLVHELKNPLGAIILNTEMLLGTNGSNERGAAAKGEGERARKRMQRILDSAKNLQAVIQSFLAYARPSQPDRDAVDCNRLIQSVLDEQAAALDHANVRVSFHPDEALAWLPADPQQLRSIFSNIITNAREALLERKDDRKLLIVTRSGQHLARIVIANNGPPLSEAIAAHLFEPFHSTKEDGTGLGLAIVRRLVELHHGTVTVSSDPDQGVSFTCEFPTPLGPAKPRAELPMPAVEAVVRDEPARSKMPKRGKRR